MFGPISLDQLEVRLDPRHSTARHGRWHAAGQVIAGSICNCSISWGGKFLVLISASASAFVLVMALVYVL